MNLIYLLQDGNTALLKACRSQRWNIARMLINSPDIRINICDNSGSTPLFVCVSGNCYDMAELLLKKNADLNGVRVSFTVINSVIILLCSILLIFWMKCRLCPTQ